MFGNFLLCRFGDIISLYSCLVEHCLCQDAMERYELGPNGGLVFCMESLKANVDWLVDQISSLLPSEDEEVSEEAVPYFVFDCPGQVELYSHHSVVQDIVRVLTKRLDMRLCSINLLDSFYCRYHSFSSSFFPFYLNAHCIYCSQPATFISAALLVTSTMLRLELPHVNVLSKVCHCFSLLFFIFL